MTNRPIASHVRAEARRLGLDDHRLNAIVGSGAGGRVSLADVRAAASVTTRPRTGTVTRPARVMASVRNPWNPHSTEATDLDVYDPNPLVSYVLATAGPPPGRAAPPTLFHSGDVPPVVASGIDPDVLRRIPWKLRHSAAMEPDRSKVLAMLEAGPVVLDDDPLLSHAGAEAFADYRQRVWSWAVPRPVEPDLTDTEYGGLFGEGEAE
jgi:hypothetical protein